jgi:hypothetical protein
MCWQKGEVSDSQFAMMGMLKMITSQQVHVFDLGPSVCLVMVGYINQIIIHGSVQNKYHVNFTYKASPPTNYFNGCVQS